jgi:8-oxo-dGTP diphosphatase
LISGRSDHLWAYISSADPRECRILIQKFNFATRYFASLENWMLPLIKKRKKLEWELDTLRYILPDYVKIDDPAYNIKELKPEHGEDIFQNTNYQEFTSVDYIKERIETGISGGIFEDEKLVAWGLTHDDGALGFLHVLPDFRRKGLGSEIVKYLINKKRSYNEPVFANIEPDNIKAINLVEKLGFVFDREIYWIKIQ